MEGNLMPGNTISPASISGILGFMVLAVTILFMVLALNSIIPQPGLAVQPVPSAAR
jgi:hypothetical protein